LNITELKKVKCSICSGYIKPLKNDNGDVVWQHGNNAMPVNDGRCCDGCNWNVVIPERLKNL